MKTTMKPVDELKDRRIKEVENAYRKITAKWDAHEERLKTLEATLKRLVGACRVRMVSDELLQECASVLESSHRPTEGE